MQINSELNTLLLMKKVVFLLILIISLLFLLPAQSRAQTTCDLCGFCQGMDLEATEESLKPPPDWEKCAECLYGTTNPNETLNSNPNPSRSYTVFGCITLGAGCPPSDPTCSTTSLVNFFIRFLTGSVAGIAFLAIVYGGAKVMLARGDPDAIREGKRYVYGAVLGLMVVLFSVFIIKFVGGTVLQIPYLQ